MLLLVTLHFVLQRRTQLQLPHEKIQPLEYQSI